MSIESNRLVFKSMVLDEIFANLNEEYLLNYCDE